MLFFSFFSSEDLDVLPRRLDVVVLQREHHHEVEEESCGGGEVPEVVVVEEEEHAGGVLLPGLGGRHVLVLGLHGEEVEADQHEDEGEHQVGGAHAVDALGGAPPLVPVAVAQLHAAVVDHVQHHVGHEDDQQVLRDARGLVDDDVEGHEGVDGHHGEAEEELLDPGRSEDADVAGAPLLDEDAAADTGPGLEEVGEHAVVVGVQGEGHQDEQVAQDEEGPEPVGVEVVPDDLGEERGADDGEHHVGLRGYVRMAELR